VKGTQGSTECSNRVFDHPLYDVPKRCLCEEENTYLDLVSGRATTVTVEGAPDISVSEQCALEGGYCECERGHVWYGEGSLWAKKLLIGDAECNNDVFGDPLFGVQKKCMCVEHGSSLDDEAVDAVDVPVTCAIDERVIVDCKNEDDFCRCDKGYMFYGDGESSWVKNDIMGSAQCPHKKCLCAELQ